MDELPELIATCRVPTGRMLRQPLEHGQLTISRAASRKYPARCTLVRVINPCPCSH
jgi:predicted ATPase with chaperone activity